MKVQEAEVPEAEVPEVVEPVMSAVVLVAEVLEAEELEAVAVAAAPVEPEQEMVVMLEVVVQDQELPSREHKDLTVPQEEPVVDLAVRMEAQEIKVEVAVV